MGFLDKLTEQQLAAADVSERSDREADLTIDEQLRTVIENGEARSVPWNAETLARVQTGELQLAPDEFYDVVGPNGHEYVPGSEVQDRLAAGYQLQDPLATRERRQEFQDEARYGDSPLAAGALGAARGVTFGLSDVVADAVGAERAVDQFRERNPLASTIGEIGGAVAPALLSGGTSLAASGAKAGGTAARIASMTPAGATARLGRIIAGTGEAKLLTRVARSAAGAGAEGALFNAGSYVSDIALGDAELSGEAFVASMGEGALWAAPFGAGFELMGSGLSKIGTKLDDIKQAKALADDEVRAATAAEKAALRVQETQAKEAIKHGNRLELERMRQSGRSGLVDQRAAAQREVAEIRAATQKETAALRAETQLATTDLRTAAQKEIAATRAAAQKAKAEARVQAAVSQKSQADARVQAALVKQETARLMIEGWDSVNKQKIVQRGITAGGKVRAAELGKEAAEVAADAKIRTSFGKIAAERGDDVLLEDLIPKHMRTEQAVTVARQQANSAIVDLATVSDDLLRVADDVVSQADDPMVAAARQKLDEATHAFADVVENGADDATATAVLARQQEAAHEALDTMGAWIDEAQKASITEKLGPRAKQGAGLVDKYLVADEMASLLGVDLPGADDLPYIGNAVNAYQKFRLFSLAAGKFGIRVPGGPATALAGKASSFVNKALKTSGSFLKGKATEVAVPTTSAILSAPIVNEAGKRQYKKAAPTQKLYEKRMAELEMFREDVDAMVRKALPGIPARVRVAVTATAQKKLDYLYETAPKDPRPPGLIKRSYRPDPVELSRWARIIRAVETPLSVLEDAVSGRLTYDAAKALRAVYPRIFAEVQEHLIEQVPSMDIPYKRRVQLSILFDAPIDETMRPEFIGAMQAGFTEEKPQPAPSLQADTDLGVRAQTGAQRRADM